MPEVGVVDEFQLAITRDLHGPVQPSTALTLCYFAPTLPDAFAVDRFASLSSLATSLTVHIPGVR